MTMRPLSLLCVTLFLVGCGSNTGLYEVSGTVTFKGAPLDHGTIRLEPEDTKEGRPGGSNIENGKFHIARERGLKPGKYRLFISSAEKGTVAVEETPGISGPPAKERIPLAFNVNSKETIEVTADGKNNFKIKIP